MKRKVLFCVSGDSELSRPVHTQPQPRVAPRARGSLRPLAAGFAARPNGAGMRLAVCGGLSAGCSNLAASALPTCARICLCIFAPRQRPVVIIIIISRMNKCKLRARKISKTKNPHHSSFLWPLLPSLNNRLSKREEQTS